MTDKALLMGINNYRFISDLRGCENDVRNVHRLLIEEFGFSESNIRQHLSGEVTKQTVLDGFSWLVDGVRAGDRLVMHFSGHGSFVDSVNDDEDIDELICLYDMDINDPGTYLVDDELGELTRRVPNGVHLSIILDTCHSGTGTRALASSGTRSLVAAGSPLAIVSDTVSRAAEVRTPVRAQTRSNGNDLFAEITEDEKRTVLARVYLPDVRLQQRKARSHIRRFGRRAMTRSATLNHQLFAGAAAEQTAADAYIDNDFHGAFTYHLCQAVRDDRDHRSAQSVMERAMQAMNGAGFSQTPQNEGPFLDAPLFGATEASSNGDKPWATPPLADLPGDTTLQSKASDAETAPEVLLAQTLRMAEKLIDLATRLEQTGAGRREPARPSTRAGEETMVYVHGISRHVEGYSDHWWKAMDDHLAGPMDRAEVLWSPVVNARALARGLSSEAEEFAAQVKLLMEDRQQQQLATLPGASRGMAHIPTTTPRGSGMSVDDFARYMYNQEEREEILAIFDGVVRPLLAEGKTINIICHSWGTVVTWEGLWRMNAANLSGRVKNLFVVGSALSMWPVQHNLFGRIGDGARPNKVQHVYNLDAKGDVVGGPIGNKFDVDQEYLGLDNLGCALWDVGCAHGSYFVEENLAVNRDIFAAILNG